MFRKIACLMMAAVMIFSLSACGKARPEDGEISVSIEETPGGQVPDGQEKDAQEPGTSLDETEAAQQSRLLPVQEIHWSCTSPGLEIQKKWPPIWPNRRGESCWR